jgi:transcription antitermination factor NusA-like protein
LVEIKGISREPGSRSKVAVAALQDGIDPVGACVGQRGIRTQAIVNELNGERIDVIEWSSDTAKFIANSLSPAKVLLVQLSEDAHGDKVANVMVDNKQLSLAIGKEGQNARLAAKLTGWRIDIKSELQVAEQSAAQAQAEAERLAALAPEQITAEETAKAAVAELEAIAAEEPSAAPAETQVTPPEAVEPAAAEETPEEATEATLEEPTPVDAEVAPEQPVETLAPVEAPAPELEITFEQALAEFEAEEEDASPEEKLKRKADRRKRTMFEFDERLGKVVAKRKRKDGRQQDWEEGLE